ncbi:unnamed protein product [Victoria cruziana]
MQSMRPLGELPSTTHTLCIITCCLPCITFGRNGQIIYRRSTSGLANAFIYCAMQCSGCACLYSYPYRTRLRGQFQLAEAPMGDCFLHCCCTLCALCQEHRELKNRWQGDKGRSNHGANVPPPVQPDMRK